MKKKIIGFIGVALFATGLYINQAQGASLQDRYNDAVEVACESARDLAYNIMIVRQTPVSEGYQIEMIKEVGVEKKAEDSALRIVKEAHAKDIVSPDFIGPIATAFGYEIKEKCLKDLTGAVL